MKILYLLSWSDKTDVGVLNKVKDQTNQWTKQNHQVEVWIMVRDNYNTSLPVELPAYKIYNQLKVKTSFPRQAERFIRQSLSAKKIHKDIQKFQPDILYLRPNIWLPWLTGILKQSTVIMEINGLEDQELKFSNFFRKTIYRLGRKSIIKQTDAFVAVTNEIGNYYKYYNKPIAVIPNGIDIKRISLANKTNHPKPVVIFVGSPGMPWHGVDKVVTLASKIPDCTFHIVGTKAEGKISPNIIVHEFMYKKELQDLYRQVDIGIGTLALHRKNMFEACPLKVREYIAYGLPLILAYDDPDVPDHELILKIPNKEDNIDTHAAIIRQFIFDNYLKTLPENIRQRVNIDEKESKRLQFFSEIIQLQKKDIIE